jgi:hypothetical protein
MGLVSWVDCAFADFNALNYHAIGSWGVGLGDECCALCGGCCDEEWFAVATNECHCVPAKSRLFLIYTLW